MNTEAESRKKSDVRGTGYNRLSMNFVNSLYGTSFDTSKWQELSSQKNAINLSQGSPNYPGSTAARYRVQQLLAMEPQPACLHQYSEMEGSEVLRYAIASYYARTCRWDTIDHTNVLVVTGASEGLRAVFQTFLNPGDEVIMVQPFIPWYRSLVIMFGGVPVVVSMKSSDNFRPPMDAIGAAVTSKMRMIVWNSPHNPTGTVATLEETKRLAEICIEHDLMLISDEVYEAHTYEKNTHIRPARLEGMFKRTVTIGSASKLFSLTGWRVGWIIAEQGILGHLQKSHMVSAYCAPTILQIGVAASFDSEEGDYEGLPQLLKRNARVLSEALLKKGLKPIPGQGGHFLVCDISATKMDSTDFMILLAAETNIVSIPMTLFTVANEDDGLGRRHIRFALCKTSELVNSAIAHLDKWERTWAKPDVAAQAQVAHRPWKPKSRCLFGRASARATTAS